jgi:hypothetical protein
VGASTSLNELGLTVCYRDGFTFTFFNMLQILMSITAAMVVLYLRTGSAMGTARTTKLNRMTGQDLISGTDSFRLKGLQGNLMQLYRIGISCKGSDRIVDGILTRN